MARNTVEKGFRGLIELPVLGSDATVGDALDRMVAAGRSSVIVYEDGFHYLHTAKSVLGASRRIYPTDPLRAVLLITNAPYLAVARSNPSRNWRNLSTDLDELIQNGIIGPGAIPPRTTQVGGLIKLHRQGFGQFARSGLISMNDVAFIITKCVCAYDDTHRWLPEQLVNGKCPEDGFKVNCG